MILKENFLGNLQRLPDHNDNCDTIHRDHFPCRIPCLLEESADFEAKEFNKHEHCSSNAENARRYFCTTNNDGNQIRDSNLNERIRTLQNNVEATFTEHLFSPMSQERNSHTRLANKTCRKSFETIKKTLHISTDLQQISLGEKPRASEHRPFCTGLISNVNRRIFEKNSSTTHKFGGVGRTPADEEIVALSRRAKEPLPWPNC